MTSRRTKMSTKSGRGLGHVTPTIFGSTVGYPDYGQGCLLAKDPVERRRCSRSRTVSGAGVLGRCPVERRKIPMIPRASRVEAALTGTHRGSKRR